MSILAIPRVWAQTLPPPAIHRLPEMTITATREERSLSEVSQAVSTVEAEEIARQTPGVLPDLLRGATGVFVQQTTPGQAAPIIRGLIGSSVLMLVDGMRLNSAFFRPAPNQYFALVDPYAVERIEVVRGPGSTLYGSDAMGGVVQVFTPVPRFTTTQWQWQGRWLGQFGSADVSQVSRFSLRGGKKGVALSSGFTYQNHDDVRDGGRLGKQHPSAFAVYAADGKVFLEDDCQDLLLNLQYVRQPKTPRFDELTPGFGQSQPSSVVFYFEPNDRLFVHGRYRWRRPVFFLDTVQLNVAFQEIKDDRRSRDFASVQEDRERNRSRWIGATFQLSSHWRDWMLFTYGGEIYLDDVASWRRRRDVVTGQISRPVSRFADGATMDSFAVYAQDEIFFHPRFTTILGGRVSYFDIAIPKAGRTVGTSLHVSDITGSVGLVYRVTPELSLVANGGRGFRAPNIFDLSTLGPRPGNRFQTPNTQLRPEEILSFDVGVKMAFARFTGEVFGFYSSYDDKIEAAPTGALTDAGRTIVQSANLNSVTLVGAEAGGRWRVRKGVEVFSSFTFTWGEEKFRDGQKTPADRIPPANGRLGALAQLTPRLWLEPFLEYAFSQQRLSARDRTDPRINPHGTPGWMAVAFRMGWEVQKDIVARLSIENLFDKAYRQHGSGINAPGVNAIVTLEAQF
ncbi:MAG: TonB-dependent receptor plug domain-containing protein [Candidatus Binatia bacterium]